MIFQVVEASVEFFPAQLALVDGGVGPVHVGVSGCAHVVVGLSQVGHKELDGGGSVVADLADAAQAVGPATEGRLISRAQPGHVAHLPLVPPLV